MFKIIKVTGNSLSPEYQAGDFVILVTSPFFLTSIRRNNILVFRHPQHGTLIKKVERVTEADGRIFMTGSHPTSIDSRSFGTISKDTVIGRVIWHVKS